MNRSTDAELLAEADTRELNSWESNALDSMMKWADFDPKTKQAKGHPLSPNQRAWLCKLLENTSKADD